MHCAMMRPGMLAAPGRWTPRRPASHSSRAPPPQAVPEAASGVWEAYNGALGAYPLTIKCLTSGLGFAGADIVAQTLSKEEDEFNPIRTARMGAFGLFLYGPASSLWYGSLDQYIFPEDPIGAVAVATKVAADQFLWAPILISSLFAWDLLGKGEGTPSNVTSKIGADLFPALVGNWSVWPLVHLVNFRFVPPEQRILYVNVVQVLFNVFLSFMATREIAAAADAGGEGGSSMEPAMAGAAASGEEGVDRRSVVVVMQGRVQGVFFRAWTKGQADSLGLSGWVRNRRDGSVEAKFAGNAEKVEEMLLRCNGGPPLASVTDVQVEEGDASSDEVDRGFEVRSTQ